MPAPPLPAAARARDLTAVREILSSRQSTQQDLDAALAHAAWYGGDAPDVLRARREIFDLLLTHGANPNGQYPSNYGPIVFGTGECLDPHGLQWLIDAGADVTFEPIDTKYGKQCPLSYWLGTYIRGRNADKHRGIDILLKHGAFIPPEVTPPMLAIHRGDAKTLASLLDADPSLVDRRFPDMPYGNIALAGATLLHCAVEFGEMECIDLLVARGADINARADIIDGVGGQTPIFHALATNPTCDHRALVRLLEHGTIDLDIPATFKLYDQKQTEAVTPLQVAERSKNAEEIALLRREVRIDNPHFRDAVAAIDAGDLPRLKQILNAHPNLVHQRAEEEGAFAGPYFRHPTLLHFIANNPNRHPTMPPNIVESTTAILDAGAPIDAMTESESGGTTLALLASSEPARRDNLQMPLIDLLVRRGADPNRAIDAAIQNGQMTAVEALVHIGARHTLLSAAGTGDQEALREMLKSNPDERRRLAAAQVAAMRGQITCMEMLLASGLDINAPLPHPYSPTVLHQAACFGHADLVQRLLELGADPARRDTRYHGTPADWAEHAGHRALAESLRSAQAHSSDTTSP